MIFTVDHALSEVCNSTRVLRCIPELGLDLGAGGVPAPRQLAKRKLRHHGHCVPALSGKIGTPVQQ